MHIPVNFSGTQTTPKSKGPGVTKTPTKKPHSTPSKKSPSQGSSLQITSPTVALPHQLKSLTLSEIVNQYLEPSGTQLPPFNMPKNFKFEKALQDALSKPNRKFENSNPNKDLSANMRALAAKNDLAHPQSPVMSKAVNAAIKDKNTTKESVESTIVLREFLSKLATISFSNHAFSRAMERGEALTCTKAIAEFFKNDKNSRTYLVFDSNESQFGLLRGNSAKDKLTFIPFAPNDALLAKTVVALDWVNTNRYIKVSNHQNEEIRTLKQYQDAFGQLQAGASVSKKLFQ